MEVTEEATSCDDDKFDGNALLPPRKRLLAGFKNQGPDGNFAQDPFSVASSSTSSNRVDAHLQSLLISHFNNPILTAEEIAETSRLNATAAIKAATAARAAADEKAAIAAKAVLAAKSALDLVAQFPDQTVLHEGDLKKNKLKRHIPAEMLYPEHHHNGTDELENEVASELHRATNNLGKASKTSSSSDYNGDNHKKPQILPDSQEIGTSYGVMSFGGRLPSMSKEYSISGELDFSTTYSGMYATKMSTTTRDAKAIGLELENAQAKTESDRLKEKTNDGKTLSGRGRKRGRPKVKKGQQSSSSSMVFFDNSIS